MKVKNNNTNKPPSSVKSASNGKSVSTGKKAGSAGGSRKSALAVSVSSTDQLAGRMAADASERSDRVAEIKLEVESGTYEADSERTADKLIESLRA